MDPATMAALGAALPEAFGWLGGLTDNIFDAATMEQQLLLEQEETAQAQAAASAASAAAAAAAAQASSSMSLPALIEAHPVATVGLVIGLAGVGILLVRR